MSIFSNQFSTTLKQAMFSAESITNLENKYQICDCSFILGILKVKKGKAFGAIEKLCSDLDNMELELLNFVKSLADNTGNIKATYSPSLYNAIVNAQALSATHGNGGSIDSANVVMTLLQFRDELSMAKQIMNKYGIHIENLTHHMMEQSDNSMQLVGGHGDSPKESEKKILKNFAYDMTSAAINKKIPVIIGCEKEVDRIVQILSRKTKNNPMIIGEAGVGKTAVVEQLAKRCIAEDAPAHMRKWHFYMVSLTDLVAGTKYRGEFEQRVQTLLEEVGSDPNIKLIIDEIHTLVGAGGGDGAMDAANILKPALARGKVRIIGITTKEDYRKKIEKDKALARRFLTVVKEEPNEAEAFLILSGIASNFESYHGVRYSQEVIEGIVSLAGRYMPERNFPDKAIDIMDEIGSKLRIELNGKDNLSELVEEFKEAKKAFDEVLANEDYDAAEKLSAGYNRLKEEIEELKTQKASFSESDFIHATLDDVRSVVSIASSIPIGHISSCNTKSCLLGMEFELGRSVASQEEAISVVAKAVRRSKVGLKERNKPAGTFLFLGLTGCGKTELAKALASNLFGTEDALIRIDCSEYSEAGSSSKLLGASPGYVGYEQPSALEPLRTKPYSVVLFDEMEKAHPNFLQTLLPILDEGRITDSNGNVIRFENAFVILTGNIGAATAQKDYMGFVASDATVKNEQVKKDILAMAKKRLAPEFLNRIGSVVVFNSLSKDDCNEIMEIIVAKNNDTFLKDIGIQINCSPAILKKMVDEGYSKEYGARPLKRKFQDMVLDDLTDYIIGSEEAVTGIIHADVNDSGKVFFANEPKIINPELCVVSENLIN